MKSRIHMKIRRTVHSPSQQYAVGDNPTREKRKLHRMAKKRERILLNTIAE